MNEPPSFSAATEKRLWPELRPAAREILELALAIARSRKDDTVTELDVVLAALFRPSHTRLDPTELQTGATYALFRAIPPPAEERVQKMMLTANADPEYVMGSSRSELPDDALMEAAPGIVEQAQLIASRVEFPSKSPSLPAIWSHHLVAAALTRRPLPPGALEVLEVSEADLGNALLDGIKQRWSEKEDFREWQDILGAEPVSVEDGDVPEGEAFPQYNHDDSRAENLLAKDQLDITPHVKAFSLLMASKDLRPPLAVGLFGDWGSGKTFFMRALRQEIDRLTRAARESELPQNQLPVYRNVVQVEFNAWHYVDSELWASLTDYIFSNLRIDEKEREEDVEERRRLYVAQLKQKGAALRQVETERRHVEDDIAVAQQELQRVRQEQQRQVGLLDVIRSGVRLDEKSKEPVEALATQMGLPKVGDSVAQVSSALSEARSVAAEGNATWNTLGGRFGYVWFAVAIASMLIGPAALVLSGLFDLSVVYQIAVSAAGFLAGGAAFVRTGTAAAKSTLARIEAIDIDLQKEIERHPQVLAQQGEVNNLSARQQDLLKREGDLRQDLIDLEKALQELSPARLLADFILSRNDTDDYRKHLGLASLIRHDFEELTRHIEAYNKSLEDGEAVPGAGKPSDTADGGGAEQSSVADAAGSLSDMTMAQQESERHLNRIILYIDDLDRCPPNIVVKVLQAVHLLLAFPLFIVVVGVDSRWLSRSLENYYEGLLGRGDEREHDENGSATPDDYLEKIFQIPFWLREMAPDAQKQLLTSLTTPPPARAETGNRSGDQDEATTQVVRPPADLPNGNANATDVRESIEQGSANNDGHDAPPDHEQARYELRTMQISVSEDALEFMQELRPLLGKSPRSLTRFVNVYRLIKAVERYRGTSDAIARGIDPDQMTMFLLAIVTGMPDISRDVFGELTRPDGQDVTFSRLVAKAREGSDGRLAIVDGQEDTFARERAEQWEELSRWLRAHQSWSRSHVGRWRDLANQVSRYSYRLDQR